MYPDARRRRRARGEGRVAAPRRRDAALGAAVRRFLAQGRAARLAGCLAVALAAVVWLSVAMVVLRIVFMLVLLLAAVWCAQLVAVILRRSAAASGPSVSAIASRECGKVLSVWG